MSLYKIYYPQILRRIWTPDKVELDSKRGWDASVHLAKFFRTIRCLAWEAGIQTRSKHSNAHICGIYLIILYFKRNNKFIYYECKNV